MSDMKFLFLFPHLLLLWTCAFTYAKWVSYFSPLHNFCHSNKKCGEWHEIGFCFSPLATSWTCAFTYAQLVSHFSLITFIILTKGVASNMKFVFLFLHLLLLWTCTLTFAQLVSFFSPLHSFYHSNKKCGEWHEICFSLSPLATSANLCIHLCSAGRLLFTTS